MGKISKGFSSVWRVSAIRIFRARFDFISDSRCPAFVSGKTRLSFSCCFTGRPAFRTSKICLEMPSAMKFKKPEANVISQIFRIFLGCFYSKNSVIELEHHPGFIVQYVREYWFKLEKVLVGSDENVDSIRWSGHISCWIVEYLHWEMFTVQSKLFTGWCVSRSWAHHLSGP